MLTRATGDALRCTLPLAPGLSASALDTVSQRQRWASNAAAATSAALPIQQPSEQLKAPSERNSLFCALATNKLDISEVGLYYQLKTQHLPEAVSATSKGAQSRPSAPPGAFSRSCSGLKDEWAASRSQAIMFRQSMLHLRAAVQQPGTRLLLQGPTGSGKSVAVASLVEWARASGWVVMYIPSAAALTRGGYFSLRPGTKQYDTILSAQYLLRCMVGSHGRQLAAMPCSSIAVNPSPSPNSSERQQGNSATSATSGVASSPVAAAGAKDGDGKGPLPGDPTSSPSPNTSGSPAGASSLHSNASGGAAAAAGRPSSSHRAALAPQLEALVGKGSLLDVANAGLQTDSDAVLAVDACIALGDGLAAAAGSGAEGGSNFRVMFAIDDYNMLHWRTEYGHTHADGHREALHADRLTLASQMRLLTGSPLGNAAVVAATTGSLGVAERIEPSRAPDVQEFHVPRYSLVEAAHAMYWYWECGVAPHKPTKRQVQRLHSLTNGNAKEVRELSPKLTLLTSGML